MKASIQVKSAIASVLHAVGLNSWMLRRHARKDVAVLMYHRIIPMTEMGPGVEAGMVVDPDTLDLHLRFLRMHFEIVPLSHLAPSPHDNTRGLSGKPLCVLTFDDGWRDFYQYAYPILKAHHAPATVFLPTDFIGTDRWFWTDQAGLLLDRLSQSVEGTKQTLSFTSPLLNKLAAIAGTCEGRLERAIAILKLHRIDTIESALTELSGLLGENSVPVGRAFLSWEEIQEMYLSGLILFGSHTAAHPFLTTLPEEQATNELRRSMKALIARKVTSTDFLSFSYPYGDFSERLSEMVREAGYHLAVTADYGWHRQGANAFQMKRIRVHQDVSFTEAMFASRLANVL